MILSDLLSKMFCSNKTALFVLESDSDHLLEVNDSFCDLVGYSSEILLSEEFSVSQLFAKPKKFRLLKKDLSKSNSSQSVISTNLDICLFSGEINNFDIFFNSFECDGAVYIWACIWKSETQASSSQIKTLLNKNTQILRDFKLNRFVYLLINSIQNTKNIDEIIALVGNKLIAREENEFSIEAFRLFVHRSDYLKCVFSTDVDSKLNEVLSDEENLESLEFLTSSNIGDEKRLDDGSLFIAINLYDLDCADAIFYVKSKNKEALKKEASWMHIISNSMAQGIRNLYLTERLRKESIEDPLTGAFNRRYFDNSIHDEVNRANRHDRNLSLLFIDIDHFKKINDDYGHQQGDICLKEVSDLCMERGRASDHFYRFGGEEFVILLPETNLKQAMRHAENLRNLISKYSFSNIIESNKPIGLTVSIGVAQYQKKTDVNAFLQGADEALYRAKDSGRNRVLSAE